MGSVISCSELIINQECCTSAFSPLLLQQPLLHPAVLSTVKPLLQLLLPMASIPPKVRKPFLRRIHHRLRIRYVCLPLQTNLRSLCCYGNRRLHTTKVHSQRYLHLPSRI